MGDDPMALLGLEGALKHYLLFMTVQTKNVPASHSTTPSLQNVTLTKIPTVIIVKDALFKCVCSSCWVASILAWAKPLMHLNEMATRGWANYQCVSCLCNGVLYKRGLIGSSTRHAHRALKTALTLLSAQYLQDNGEGFRDRLQRNNHKPQLNILL
jgi:hypothetical protein